MRRHGYEVYLVGGCVRDMLMGVTPHDYDMTTNALPKETAKCFSDLRVIPTGMKHGTVTVVIDDLPVEITTYRRDGEYDDNRHPRQVTFTPDLRDDLSRRDFTVNAIACDEHGTLVDPFGGREDIEKGIIRCVGDPDARFSEDGLRIMRALRFASVLGFSLDPDTASSVKRNRELLRNISAERLREEFIKLICGKNFADILREYYEVIGVFIPEILPMVGFDQRTKYHNLDVFEHTLAMMGNCDANDKILRLSAFFHDIGKPESYTFDGKSGHFYGHAERSEAIADAVMKRLKFDNDTRKKVKRLVAEHMTPIGVSERSARRFVSEHTEKEMQRAFAIAYADRHSCAPRYQDDTEIKKAEEIVRELLLKEERISLRTLAVRGDDLIALGFSGRELGRCLDTLLARVLDGELPNEKAALIDAAIKLK
ncbi:MAG: HD domain-containing protein [Ruminococcaceae bacterium]|nr:HD domain-containing protein [Oscillospiraceae bacterium]